VKPTFSLRKTSRAGQDLWYAAAPPQTHTNTQTHRQAHGLPRWAGWAGAATGRVCGAVLGHVACGLHACVQWPVCVCVDVGLGRRWSGGTAVAAAGAPWSCLGVVVAHLLLPALALQGPGVPCRLVAAACVYVLLGKVVGEPGRHRQRHPNVPTHAQRNAQAHAHTPAKTGARSARVRGATVSVRTRRTTHRRPSQACSSSSGAASTSERGAVRPGKLRKSQVLHGRAPRVTTSATADGPRGKCRRRQRRRRR
jgi:hypothetical protein